MINTYDIAYSLGLGLTAPVWFALPKPRRKVLKALRERMGRVEPRHRIHGAVMIHAVSLGEINATRALVDLLRAAQPDLAFIISTTTDTGYARGEQLYGNAPDVTLIRYPLDFSSGVSRVLDGLKPSLVVLMELEVWPNFLLHCKRRDIPVMLANGRMSTSSHRNYKWIKPIVAAMFRRLARLCVQDAEYANRFIELGAPPENVVVTGTMKFDNAEPSDRVAGDAELAEAVGPVSRPGNHSGLRLDRSRRRSHSPARLPRAAGQKFPPAAGDRPAQARAVRRGRRPDRIDEVPPRPPQPQQPTAAPNRSA